MSAGTNKTNPKGEAPQLSNEVGNGKVLPRSQVILSEGPGSVESSSGEFGAFLASQITVCGTTTSVVLKVN